MKSAIEMQVIIILKSWLLDTVPLPSISPQFNNNAHILFQTINLEITTLVLMMC